MHKYSKIETLFDRDEHFRVIEGQFRRPEFAIVKEWVATEKVDGTNVRLGFYRVGEDDFAYSISGKTDDAQLHVGLMSTLNQITSLIAPRAYDVMQEHGLAEYTLYGEGYGEKIQSGGGYRAGQGFVLFDVLAQDSWLDPEQVFWTAEYYGLTSVPRLGKMSTEAIVDMCRTGFPSFLAENPAHKQAEGVVARPAVPLYDRRGERVMWKLKSKDFVSKGRP